MNYDKGLIFVIIFKYWEHMMQYNMYTYNALTIEVGAGSVVSM